MTSLTLNKGSHQECSGKAGPQGKSHRGTSGEHSKETFTPAPSPGSRRRRNKEAQTCPEVFQLKWPSPITSPSGSSGQEGHFPAQLGCLGAPRSCPAPLHSGLLLLSHTLRNSCDSKSWRLVALNINHYIPC